MKTFEFTSQEIDVMKEALTSLQANYKKYLLTEDKRYFIIEDLIKQIERR